MPYNCHVHLFSVRNLPNAFYGFPGFATIADKPMLASAAVGFLDKLTKLTGNDNQRRMIAFAKIGMLQTQREVFMKLWEAYDRSPDWKFVVLTMDMDHMNAGKARENFYAQIEEIYQLKKEFPNQIFAFSGFDPRNADALPTAKLCIEKKHFYGIKLYPPLGFYPFDHRMEALYAYAEANRIPLMTHCDIGGIHYQGDEKWGMLKKKNRVTDAHKYPVSFATLPDDLLKSLQKEQPYDCYRYNFSNPRNYYPVLERFPDLKICLAHAGGSVYMADKKPDKKDCSPLGLKNWFEEVKSLMAKYKNVYTDISYTLFEHDVFDEIRSMIDQFPNQVIFGTDFFMTEKENPERKLVSDFRLAVTAEQWKSIAEDNPKAYLSSVFHP